jgi:predicted MPP superfamily phosphohydrolase
VILGLFLGSIWYVSFRLRVLFGLTRRWPLRIAIAIGFISSLLTMFSGVRVTSALLGTLSIVGGYFFGLFVILTLLLLALHAVQLKWSLPRKWTALLTLTLALSITASGALWANHFRVSEIEIPLDGLKRDVVLMHIPDVHIGHHRGKHYLAKIVVETNRSRPDIVLINGDLVDSNVALLPGVLSPLSDFEAPVYFTGGNHENYVDRQRALELINKYGGRILHNEVVDTHGIYLVGLDYMNPDQNTFDMHPSEDKRTIKDVLPNIPLKDDQLSVLMHHSPVGVRYVSQKGIDLMLSGHTHAGQMFPNTLLAPIFFSFNKGLYKEGSTNVFVSQGAGTYGPRIRLGSSNEINLIRLKKKQ